jgi:4,5-dihydroxyphthalate decarboxylase
MRLTLATWDHDRCMPLHEGRVSIPEVEFESHILPTGKLFPIAVQEARFDITELSISSYILQVSRGESAYTAIPAWACPIQEPSGLMWAVKAACA